MVKPFNQNLLANKKPLKLVGFFLVDLKILSSNFFEQKEVISLSLLSNLK